MHHNKLAQLTVLEAQNKSFAKVGICVMSAHICVEDDSVKMQIHAHFRVVIPGTWDLTDTHMIKSNFRKRTSNEANCRRQLVALVCAVLH